MTKNKAAVWLFGVATLLAYVAALLPLLKGGRVNVTFLSVGVVFGVLTAAAVRRARSAGDPPP